MLNIFSYQSISVNIFTIIRQPSYFFDNNGKMDILVQLYLQIFHFLIIGKHILRFLFVHQCPIQAFSRILVKRIDNLVQVT